MQVQYTIYILELEHGKYYVGKTQNLDVRVLQHIGRRASAWTTFHPFVRLVEYFIGDSFDEDKYTLRYMANHGINNVRGGTYCNINLSQDQYVAVMKSIRSSLDLCLGCGRNGHFIRDCKTEICCRCGRLDHNASDCGYKNHVHEWSMNCCYRCSRSDHWAWRCNRTFDIYGRKLEPRFLTTVFKGLMSE